MGLRSLFVSVLTAFTATACSHNPSLEDVRDLGARIPKQTVYDPKTGCEYDPAAKDPKCIIRDFPAPEKK